MANEVDPGCSADDIPLAIVEEAYDARMPRRILLGYLASYEQYGFEGATCVQMINALMQRAANQTPELAEWHQTKAAIMRLLDDWGVKYNPHSHGQVLLADLVKAIINDPLKASHPGSQE